MTSPRFEVRTSGGVLIATAATRAEADEWATAHDSIRHEPAVVVPVLVPVADPDPG